jgi:hypothetical protein
VRNVRHQRAERNRTAEADHHLSQGVSDEAAGIGGADITDCKESGANKQDRNDSGAVEQASHGHTAGRAANHGERERQRHFRARHAELGLHCRQRHDDRPHADAADGGNENCDRKPSPGRSRIRRGYGLHRITLMIVLRGGLRPASRLHAPFLRRPARRMVGGGSFVE